MPQGFHCKDHWWSMTKQHLEDCCKIVCVINCKHCGPVITLSVLDSACSFSPCSTHLNHVILHISVHKICHLPSVKAIIISHLRYCTDSQLAKGWLNVEILSLKKKCRVKLVLHWFVLIFPIRPTLVCHLVQEDLSHGVKPRTPVWRLAVSHWKYISHCLISYLPILDFVVEDLCASFAIKGQARVVYCNCCNNSTRFKII